MIYKHYVDGMYFAVFIHRAPGVALQQTYNNNKLVDVRGERSAVAGLTV
jgi:hypothetical protein